MGTWITVLPCLFALIFPAMARGQVYDWVVKHELKSPSSYKKFVVTINGVSPGPTVQARLRSRVLVRVTNRLREDLAILWDGTQECNYLGSDGTEAINQRLISPGSTHTYCFVANRLGKFSYYSHYPRQKLDGLYGSIDVMPPYGHAETSAYDYGKSIILDDQYYISNYDWAAEPESLFIPSKGKFDYANSATPSSHPTALDAINLEYSHLRVVPGKTYPLNIWSVTNQSDLSFQIESHNLTVVEADGHYVEPFVNQRLIVYSGKKYSVKIKADQDPSRNYSITTNIVGQNTAVTTPLGLAMLSYSPPAGLIRNGITLQTVQSMGNKACQEYQMMLAILLIQVWMIRR